MGLFVLLRVNIEREREREKLI